MLTRTLEESKVHLREANLKVLLISNEVPPAGGVGTFFVEIIESAKEELNLDILFSNKKNAQPIRYGGRVLKGVSNWLGPLKFVPSLIKRRGEKYDLIILNDVRAVTSFGVCNMFGFTPSSSKNIAIIHGSELERFVVRPRLSRRLLGYPVIYLYGLRVIENLAFLGLKLRQKCELQLSHFGLKNLKFIDLVSRGKISELKYREIAIDPLKKRFVTACRLDLRKGFAKMLLLLLELEGRGIEINWDIFGDGRDRLEIEKLILNSKLGSKVKFHGFVPKEELKQRYKSYDFFLGLSRLDEGFGLAWHEAGLMGLPIIASNKGELANQLKVFDSVCSDNDEEIIDFVLRTNSRKVLKHPDKVLGNSYLSQLLMKTDI